MGVNSDFVWLSCDRRKGRFYLVISKEVGLGEQTFWDWMRRYGRVEKRGYGTRLWCRGVDRKRHSCDCFCPKPERCRTSRSSLIRTSLLGKGYLLPIYRLKAP